MPRTIPKQVDPNVQKEYNMMMEKMRQQRLQQINKERADVLKETAAKMWRKAHRKKQKCMINPFTDRVIALKGKIGLAIKNKQYNPRKKKKSNKKK